MAVFTIYSSVESWVASHNAGYATMRAGSGLWNGGANCGSEWVGQKYDPATPEYIAYEGFQRYDTSGLAGKTLISADFWLYFAYSYPAAPGVTITYEVRSKTFPASTVDNTFWVPGANLGNYTRVGYWVYPNNATANIYKITNESVLASINKTGYTDYVLSSNRLRLGNTPTTDEFAWFVQADSRGFLRVTTEDPPAPSRLNSANRLW